MSKAQKVPQMNKQERRVRIPRSLMDRPMETSADKVPRFRRAAFRYFWQTQALKEKVAWFDRVLLELDEDLARGDVQCARDRIGLARVDTMGPGELDETIRRGFGGEDE